MGDDYSAEKVSTLRIAIVAAIGIAAFTLTRLPHNYFSGEPKTKDLDSIIFVDSNKEITTDAGPAEPAAVDADNDSDSLSYAWPIPETENGWNRGNSCYGTRNTSAGARFHDAVDIGAAKKAKVVAVQDGIVERVCRVEKGCNCSTNYEPCGSECAGDASCRGEGNVIYIAHDDGNLTRYLHLDRVAKGLEKGDAVKKGEVIGAVGNSGRSVGTHLHFSMFSDGEPVDPFCYYSEILPKLDLSRDNCKNLYGVEKDASEFALARHCNHYHYDDEEPTLASGVRR
jgi:murein DD-endopeptidase MepM/ murein hydrolase activator NlpD